MAGVRNKYRERMLRAGEALTADHVRAHVDAMLEIMGLPLPPPQIIGADPKPVEVRKANPTAPKPIDLLLPESRLLMRTDVIGRVTVRMFADGSCDPEPDQVVQLAAAAHAQRQALDDANHARGAGHLDLTDDERARGLVRPRWSHFKHVPCGRIVSFVFDDAVEGMALDNARTAHRTKGLQCLCDNDMHPIVGDLHGRPGEFVWVDSAGRVTPIKVGS